MLYGLCVTGSNWAIKLELNLYVYRNVPIAKLCFLNTAIAMQSFGYTGWFRSGNSGMSLAASCERLGQHLGPIFFTALRSDSSCGVCIFFSKPVMHSLSNAPHVGLSMWAGSVPPSEVKRVLSALLLRRHMPCEWQWWAPPAGMGSTPFTDKPSEIAVWVNFAIAGGSSFLPSPLPSSFPFLPLSLPPSLLDFYLPVVLLSEWSTPISYSYFTNHSIINSIINQFHEQYAK